MNRKNEKGFALVLSLVLLMAMSLMGGALIVISASDHRSNNVSDEYQQTFYVAETALFEGEKYLINQFLGPYNTSGIRQTQHKKSTAQLTNSTTVFDPVGQDIEGCYSSFSDLDRISFKIMKGQDPSKPFDFANTNADVVFEKNYFNFINELMRNRIYKDQSYKAGRQRNWDDTERLKKFKYQYFITRGDPAPFKGYGSSIKKGATDNTKSGRSFTVYGCGNFDNGKIIVPLESTLVLPNQ